MAGNGSEKNYTAEDYLSVYLEHREALRDPSRSLDEAILFRKQMEVAGDLYDNGPGMREMASLVKRHSKDHPDLADSFTADGKRQTGRDLMSPSDAAAFVRTAVYGTDERNSEAEQRLSADPVGRYLAFKDKYLEMSREGTAHHSPDQMHIIHKFSLVAAERLEPNPELMIELARRDPESARRALIDVGHGKPSPEATRDIGSSVDEYISLHKSARTALESGHTLNYERFRTAKIEAAGELMEDPFKLVEIGARAREPGMKGLVRTFMVDASMSPSGSLHTVSDDAPEVSDARYKVVQDLGMDGALDPVRRYRYLHDMEKGIVTSGKGVEQLPYIDHIARQTAFEIASNVRKIGELDDADKGLGDRVQLQVGATSYESVRPSFHRDSGDAQPVPDLRGRPLADGEERAFTVKDYVEAFDAHRRSLKSPLEHAVEPTLLDRRIEIAESLSADSASVRDLAAMAAKRPDFQLISESYLSDVKRGSGATRPTDEEEKLVQRIVLGSDRPDQEAERAFREDPVARYEMLKKSYFSEARSDSPSISADQLHVLQRSIGATAREIEEKPENLIALGKRNDPDFALMVMADAGRRQLSMQDETRIGNLVSEYTYLDSNVRTHAEVGDALEFEKYRRARVETAGEIAQEPFAMIAVGMLSREKRTENIDRRFLVDAGMTARDVERDDPRVVEIREKMEADLGLRDAADPVKRYIYLHRLENEAHSTKGDPEKIPYLNVLSRSDAEIIASDPVKIAEVDAASRGVFGDRIQYQAGRTEHESVRPSVIEEKRRAEREQSEAGSQQNQGTARQGDGQVQAGDPGSARPGPAGPTQSRPESDFEQAVKANANPQAKNDALYELAASYRVKDLEEMDRFRYNSDADALALPLTRFSYGGGVIRELAALALADQERAKGVYKATVLLRDTIARDKTFNGSEDMKVMHDELEMARRSMARAFAKEDLKVEGEDDKVKMRSERGQVVDKEMSEPQPSTVDAAKKGYAVGVRGFDSMKNTGMRVFRESSQLVD